MAQRAQLETLKNFKNIFGWYYIFFALTVFKNFSICENKSNIVNPFGKETVKYFDCARSFLFQLF